MAKSKSGSLNARTQGGKSGVIDIHSNKKTHLNTNNGRGGSSITAKQLGIKGAGNQTKNN